MRNACPRGAVVSSTSVDETESFLINLNELGGLKSLTPNSGILISKTRLVCIEGLLAHPQNKKIVSRENKEGFFI